MALWIYQVGSCYDGVRQFIPTLDVTYHFYRTLFWAGDTFAPKLRVKNGRGENVPIQQFLQNAFLDMFELVARTIGDLDGVIGFEVLSFLCLIRLDTI